MYDLIELIIEVSLWFKDYSIFDTHPQHTRLCLNNAYLICVIVHVQMWCICSITYRSNPKKIFESFICFWKWFYTFVSLVFDQNAFLCFSPKSGPKAVSWEAHDLEPMLWILFRSRRNGRNLSYRYANQNRNSLCSTSGQISTKFWLVSGIPVNSGKFRPKCNFRPEWVLPFFFFFLFLFFNLRIFFTITCKNFLSSTDSILHHSIKYNPKIHNNEVMNTEREREREREG